MYSIIYEKEPRYNETSPHSWTMDRLVIQLTPLISSNKGFTPQKTRSKNSKKNQALASQGKYCRPEINMPAMIYKYETSGKNHICSAET